MNLIHLGRARLPTLLFVSTFQQKSPGVLSTSGLHQKILDVVAGLLHPGFRHWADSAGYGVELSRLDDRGAYFEGNRTVGSSQSNGLEVRVLNSVLVGRLVFPALGVLVANVLRSRVALLSAYLTDLRHCLLFGPKGWDASRDNTRLRDWIARGLGGQLGSEAETDPVRFLVEEHSILAPAIVVDPKCSW